MTTNKYSKGEKETGTVPHRAERCDICGGTGYLGTIYPGDSPPEGVVCLCIEAGKCPECGAELQWRDTGTFDYAHCTACGFDEEHNNV